MPVLNSVRPGEAGERSMGKWSQLDGNISTALFEWTTAAPAVVETLITTVKERILAEGNRGNRPEEVRTLEISAVFQEGPRTALVYQCSQQPTNLRDVFLKVPKPGGNDRRALSRIIATQVRSLHVHFQLLYPGLRTESFVFFGDARPDLSKPYVLDWAHLAPPDMYRHPEFQEDKPLWFYQVWSLMMVLTEIAEWRPLDRVFQDEGELRRRQLERRQLVTSDGWKGAPTAEIFRFGFSFLEKDRNTLEQCSHWEVKRFYDGLCELLAPLPGN